MSRYLRLVWSDLVGPVRFELAWPRASGHGRSRVLTKGLRWLSCAWPWLDERYPLGPVEPPVIGRFENGTGTFYSDDVVDGRKIRTRYIWGHITPTSARWEQATSLDSGRSWETNWIMEFQRR